MKNKTNLTDWVSIETANSFIAEKIASGEYKKGEIKKSSYKFTNGKDKTDGYMCRVQAIHTTSDTASEDKPLVTVTKAEPVTSAKSEEPQNLPEIKVELVKPEPYTDEDNKEFDRQLDAIPAENLEDDTLADFGLAK